MSRDAQITTYVDEATEEAIEQVAHEDGLSKSAAARELIEQALLDRKQDAVSTEVKAAQQLQRVIDDSKRDIQRATRHMSEMAALASVYAAANFELIKDDHPQASRREALDTGRRRTRANVDERPVSIEFGQRFADESADDTDQEVSTDDQDLVDFDDLED